MKSALLIILNPYNLIALMFATSGIALWGGDAGYRFEPGAIGYFKVFGIPTLAFAACWLGIYISKRPSKWILYFGSFLSSLGAMVVISLVYWQIVGRP